MTVLRHLVREKLVEIIGILDLFNIFWRESLNSGSTDEWCMYYAPNKAGFGFPDDTRAAVVIDRCTASTF